MSKVLNTLANNGVKIKVKKCDFFQPEVTFLGHTMNAEGIKKSTDYIQKVKDYPKPETVTELRRFLGLVNFQRKYISHCSIISKPLSEVTGGYKKSKIK